ncbi:MAG: sulfatase-like hydrolase/transferase [Planctomycetaceae bacterium]
MQPIATFLDEQVRGKPFPDLVRSVLPHVPFDAGPEFSEPYRKQGLPALRIYAEITRFDHTVGRHRNACPAGLAHNTLIVFASDNGYRPEESENKKIVQSACRCVRNGQLMKMEFAHHCCSTGLERLHRPGTKAWCRRSIYCRRSRQRLGREQALPKNLPGQNLLPVCLGEMNSLSDRRSVPLPE